MEGYVNDSFGIIQATFCANQTHFSRSVMQDSVFTCGNVSNAGNAPDADYSPKNTVYNNFSSNSIIKINILGCQ